MKVLNLMDTFIHLDSEGVHAVNFTRVRQVQGRRPTLKPIYRLHMRIVLAFRRLDVVAGTIYLVTQTPARASRMRDPRRA